MSDKYLCVFNEFSCPYCSLVGECTMSAHDVNPEEMCEMAWKCSKEEAIRLDIASRAIEAE